MKCVTIQLYDRYGSAGAAKGAGYSGAGIYNDHNEAFASLKVAVIDLMKGTVLLSQGYLHGKKR